MAISAAVTATSTITSTTDIKFSTLRRRFLKMNPRTTYGGSETFDAETGSVSASQLLRQTSFSDGVVNEESDIDYKIPFVPDSTENSNITTANDWKTSQFVNAVKYYYLQQTGSDNLNLDISAQSWNTNLDNTIRKWLFVDAIIGSTTSTAAASISSVVNSLTLKISSTGRIYGDSGEAGVQGVDLGNGLGVGGSGGDALNWSTTGNANNYIILENGSRLYAGGGGGGRGASGGAGGQGGSGGRNNVFCSGPGSGFCSEDVGSGGSGGSAINGASGGKGAGYSNQSGPSAGSLGGFRNAGAPPNHFNSGSGGPSGYNKAGGPGGNFGAPGTSRVGSVNNSATSDSGTPYTRGATGNPGNIQGSGTFCGGGGIPPPGVFINCSGRGSQPGFVGGFGTDGKLGGPSGAAIKRATNAFPYTLIGDNTDTMKGPENVG